MLLLNNLKVIKQLNTMVLITIITQVFILLKNAIVASIFGISIELDAFNLANNITTFIYSFIGAGISTVIIPYLKNKVNKSSVNIFISVIYSIAFLLLVLVFFFNEEIISVASNSNSIHFIKLAANLLLFTCVTGFINSIIQLTKGILEFNELFNVQKLIVLFTNILLVVLLLFLQTDNIYYYTIIIFITTLISFLFHIFFLRKTNFKFSLSYDLDDRNFKEMISLFLPIVFSTGVYQISLLIDTLIAARLPVGSISTLTYANAVISMINLLLLGNITSFVYPKLVKKTDNKERQISLVDYILLVNTLMCLIIVLFYSSGHAGISLLFERGEFTRENTTNVFIIALILSVSLPSNGIRDLLYRYFYMNKDTLTPFKNSIVISLINILLSILLSIYFGLYGVVLGTILASFISLFLISLKFKRKFQIHFNSKLFIVENSKIVFITFISILVSILIKNIFIIENSILALIIYSIPPLLLYVLLLRFFKSKVFKLKL